MKVLVFGVIYQGSNPYLEDYFTTIYNQNRTDFDILIIEDNFKLPKRFVQNNMIILQSYFKTPAQIRLDGINFAKKYGYEILLFTDTDDYYSLNRINNTIENITNFSFICNNLLLVDNNKNVLEEIFIPENIDFRELLKGNFFGLSNTAVRLSAFPDNFVIPSSLIAVDWWIYSNLLLNGSKYIIDFDITTFYRQHDKNTSVNYESFSERKLNFILKVKIEHYRNLLQYANFKNQKDKKIVNQYLSEFVELESKIDNKYFKDTYLETINKNYSSIKKGWWSEVITYEEFQKYV